MMIDCDKDMLAIGIIVGVLIALLLGIDYAENAHKCNAWNKAGYSNEYSFIQGCLVEVSDGVWVNSKNVRIDVELKSKQ